MPRWHGASGRSCAGCGWWGLSPCLLYTSNAVADLRVDIGLIEGPCHAADIIAEPWLEDELVVFAAPDSPLLELSLIHIFAADNRRDGR